MSVQAPTRSAWRHTAPVDDPDRRYRQILLASEGRPFSDETIAQVAAIAAPGAHVRVFSVARIHGVAFGMPNPGLLPTKAEWAEQRELTAKAIKRLKRRRLTADGHVVGTRNPTKMIVMGADPDRNRVVGNAIWNQEPQRVRRKSKLPVYLAIG